MNSHKFAAGKYFIGDLHKVLSYENLCKLTSEFGNLGEFTYANFEIGMRDDGIIANDGFSYYTDSGTLGVIDARIIDEDLLSERILTIHGGILTNKFTMFKLGRIACFESEFIILRDDNEIRIGDIIFQVALR